MVMARKTFSTDTVGLALAHDSARLHVTGAATYIDDMREPDGLLHVFPGFAKEGARGKIKSIDLEPVRRAPGVVAVLTAKDIPGVNDCSPSIGGDPILANGTIEFHAQVIFAVVAETGGESDIVINLRRRRIGRNKIDVFIRARDCFGDENFGPAAEGAGRGINAPQKAGRERVTRRVSIAVAVNSKTEREVVVCAAAGN